MASFHMGNLALNNYVNTSKLISSYLVSFPSNNCKKFVKTVFDVLNSLRLINIVFQKKKKKKTRVSP